MVLKYNERNLTDLWMITTPNETSVPKIVSVNVIVPNKVVEVEFDDKTKEKAVCNESDVFSLETAIAICVSKKVMGGSNPYNNTIKQGLRVYNKQLKEEAEVKAEFERIEKKRAKRKAYKERCAAKKREAEIEIQKEAYIRAMRELRKDWTEGNEVSC